MSCSARLKHAEGRAAAIFELCRRGYCTVILSPHALEEARRNLELKCPGAVPRLERLLGAVEICQECSAESAGWARTHGLPDKDAPILGAAAQAKAELLVTGDRTHFGHLFGKTLRGVRIVTPADALARVL